MKKVKKNLQDMDPAAVVAYVLDLLVAYADAAGLDRVAVMDLLRDTLLQDF